MRDTHATRRPALRLAEVTVWDVLTLTFEGARAGHFKEGQSFQVSLLRIYLTGLAVLRACHFFFLSLFLSLGYQFDSDAEECVDGPKRGGRTRVPQYE
jgi:hypothetical protein